MELNSNNYYSQEANAEYFSVSQFKDFLSCEGRALAKIKGEYIQPITKPMLIGSFVDSYFEGTLQKFIIDNPIVFTRKNELRSEFKKANDIIARIKNDKLFMQFMSGTKQQIITFELFNVKWKMKMDSYIEGKCIVDLKVVANFKSLPYWRYDIQGAIYQQGVEAITGNKLPFYLAVATKEQTIDLDVFQIPQSTLDMALKDVGASVGRFSDIKNGFIDASYCGECDYCKSIKMATIRNYNELMEV